MTTATNIGIALTAVFAVSLGVLVAQISWVLWKRNNQSLRHPHGGSSSLGDLESGGYYVEPAKATKDSCCCRKGGNSSSTKAEPDSGRGHPGATMGDGPEEGFDEVIKYWRRMCRESRILFTIKEEEKEGESDGNGGLATLEPEEEEKKKERRVCLREWLETKQESLDRKTAIIIMSALRTELTQLSQPHVLCQNQHSTPSSSPPVAELDNTGKNCT
ncbi:hypothetical protein MLD38_020301 [Melastoma candidum]|uniref:Uncharacterized protein n=1 Tax=Melastoma candidum TaxID=119954 RepID=A0ACB9QDE9_9MYRT|nr:hypothetical protein MLD38_020301 [Melastoma candidum]